MTGTIAISNTQHRLRARVVRAALTATLSAAVIAVASGPMAPSIEAADPVAGPASVMDVFAELRRHHIREYRLDELQTIAHGPYLRDHHEREYGSPRP